MNKIFIYAITTILLSFSCSLRGEEGNRELLLQAVDLKLEGIKEIQEDILAEIEKYFQKTESSGKSVSREGTIRLTSMEELKNLEKLHTALFATSKEDKERVKELNRTRQANAEKLKKLIAQDDLEGMHPFAMDNLDRKRRELLNKAYKLLARHNRGELKDYEKHQLDELKKQFVETNAKLQAIK